VYWNASTSTWTPVGGITVGGGSPTNGWGLTGNSINNGEYLGTTNNQDLIFRVNNQNIGDLSINGAVSFGRNTDSSGQTSIGIGQGARSTQQNAIAIGNGAQGTSSNTIVMGSNSQGTSNNAIAIGNNARTLGGNGIALGSGAQGNSNNAIAIGNNSQAAQQQNTIAIGNNTRAVGENGVALGNGAQATQENSIAIGNNSQTSGVNSIAIGNNIQAPNQGTLILGNNDTNASNINATKVGIGTNNPTAKLQVNGSIRYIDGNQAAGRVLTSDGNGNATWQAASGGASGTALSYVQIYSNSTSSGLNTSNPIQFGTTSLNNGFNVFNDNVQTMSITGLYRITYTLNLERGSGNSNGTLGFFITQGFGATNKIPGSSSFTTISNSNVKTITKSFLVDVNSSFQQFYIFSDTTANNVSILSDSSFTMELVIAD